ncbi:hypothetical protein HNP55_000096 [Paucibacter oligotrophus]|uniref:TMEM205-like domain-containing protein n=1 Tax=Roseateles oligotrophus TaxID=1769250 RepID=A0A840L193_9BURK|nr:hypothetical protein [Roseateles oligotrophus]
MLAALWAGLLLCVGLVAAPSAFAVLERPMAGLVVAQLFQREAMLSLFAAVLLILMERRRAREGAGSAVTAEVLLPAAALFCTVAGYYALQPMMAAAKAGQGAWSFMALHSISLLFFALKGLLVMALAWRLGKC